MVGVGLKELLLLEALFSEVSFFQVSLHADELGVFIFGDVEFEASFCFHVSI